MASILIVSGSSEGDFYLLGRPLQAHVIGYRTGHTENHALARRIAEQEGTMVEG